MKKAIGLCVASLLALGLTARAALAPTVADIAVSTPDLSTLVTALKQANLVDALKGAGPFTVFAPNNAAFAKIGKAKLDGILKNKELLKQILLYHVVSGKYLAADVKKLPSGAKLKTLNGEELTLKTSNGVMVNYAKVIKTDIIGSNGVVHVIDTVIIPTGKK